MLTLFRVTSPLWVCALIALLDPLGAYTATNKVSRELAFRVAALTTEHDSRSQVAVVLLDDPSADILNGEFGYPITFANQAEIVRAVLCGGPASLFLDFSFRNIRTRDPNARVPIGTGDVAADLDDFIKALRVRAQDGDVRCPSQSVADGRRSANSSVYLARTRSVAEDNCDPLFEHERELPVRCRAARELQHLSTVVSPLTLARADPDGAYLIAVPPRATYPLPPEVLSTKSRVEASPALAAVLTFCASAPADIAARFTGCRDRAELAALLTNANPSARLTPIWGYHRVPGTNAASLPLAERCKPAQSKADLVQPWTAVVLEFARALVKGQTEAASGWFGAGACLPVETVTAMELIALRTACQEADCKAAAGRVVAGRMVFYGASVADAHDEIESPVLGLVPGVAVHATAAANLLAYGTSFVREAPDWSLFGLKLSGNTAVEMAIVAVWFVVLLGLGRSADMRAFRIWVLVRMTAVAVTALVTLALFNIACWSPANWVGLLTALLTVQPDATPNKSKTITQTTNT